MGSGAPLLNEYKRQFFWRRLPQTFLGGPKLKLSHKAPAYVYAVQLSLLVTPPLLSIPFTVLVDKSILTPLIGTCAYCGVGALFVLAVQNTVLLLRNKPSSITATPVAMFSIDDDEDDFDSMAAVDFIVPPKKYKINVLVHATVTFAVCGGALLYALPTTFSDLYGSMAMTVIMSVLSWFTVAIAQYSLTVAPPPEPATLTALDHWELAPLTRPLHLIIFFAFDLLARYLDGFYLVNQILHAVFVLLPILWTLGILPPFDVLILWVAEQANITLFGSSPVLSNIRLFMTLFASIACCLAAYFIPTALASTTVMAGFGYILSLNSGALYNRVLSTCPTKRPRLTDVIRERFLWRWSYREVIFHLIMLASVVGVAAAVTTIPTADMEMRMLLTDLLAYSIMGLLTLDVLLSELQQATVVFGLARNPIYPMTTSQSAVFINRKRKMQPMAILNRITVSFVCPGAMLLLLCLRLDFTFPLGDPSASINKFAIILGTCRAFRWIWQDSRQSLWSMSLAEIITRVTAPTSTWQTLGVGIQILLASLACDRICALARNVSFVTLLTYTSVTGDREKRPRTLVLIAAFLLAPFSVLSIVIASIISAPILPLFTLPIFLVAFPRPVRSPCAACGGTMTTADGTLYEQMVPTLSKVLRHGFACGSLGSPSAGDVYLARCDDRTMWISVLERGYAYCRVVMRGLELEATSCHAVEVTRLDDSLGTAFEHCGPFIAGGLTRWRDSEKIYTYSNACGQLTGVLDSPDVRLSVADYLPKTLIWLLLRTVRNCRTADEFAPPLLDGAPGRPKSASIRSDYSDWSDASTISPPNVATKPTKKQPTTKTDRLTSGMSRIDIAKFYRENTLSPLPVMHKKRHSAEFGMPSADETARYSVDIMSFSCAHSSQFAMPDRWRNLPTGTGNYTGMEFPLDWYEHVLQRILTYEATDDLDTEEIADEVSTDDLLCGAYTRLVTACVAILNGLEDHSENGMTISEINKLYQGDMPWSEASDWLDDNSGLRTVVIKAFRYAVKLAIDETLLGAMESWQELADTLTEYDTTWYIGLKSELEWTAALKESKPSLFSMSYNSVTNTYESQQLTLQKIPVYICSLNAASVRGHQAALTLELLYMTNDDEERYSIQANALTLRNLAMQAADPPLGYSVYTSYGLTVPTL